VTEGKVSPAGLQPERLAEAETELARVRELLTAAARGDATAVEVKESVQGYLDEHGPALRVAAGALTEELRQRTLEELYKWRAQLNTQLQAQHGQPSPAPGAHTAEPTGLARPESAETGHDQDAPGERGR
jgi:hypothetical protein